MLMLVTMRLKGFSLKPNDIITVIDHLIAKRIIFKNKVCKSNVLHLLTG